MTDSNVRTLSKAEEKILELFVKSVAESLGRAVGEKIAERLPETPAEPEKDETDAQLAARLK